MLTAQTWNLGGYMYIICICFPVHLSTAMYIPSYVFTTYIPKMLPSLVEPCKICRLLNSSFCEDVRGKGLDCVKELP